VEHGEAWWTSAVVYQIYPRSFCDASGDGIGDLAGIRSKLDYLQWLGVDAIWLSPIYPSPMRDFGYDVADYCDVDPLFGDLATFDELVAAAHSRGIRVLLDWVANHTSDQHPWFRQSRASRDGERRDWYLWRDGCDGGPPNNWVAAFSDVPAWTYDDATQQWYLHLFLPEQPDLNWRNGDVVEAMHQTLRFWLDRGVDGFRADVVHLLGKDPRLPDDPPQLAGRSRVGFHDEPFTHELLRGIRAVIDTYEPPRMMVGEVNLSDSAALTTYYGDDDELHLAFNFVPLQCPWDAARWRAVITEIESTYGPAGAWPTWVLSNHDQSRHRTRYGGSEARARAAAVLLLTLRGTPFLYAGEELGLEDADVPPERVVDPGGRDPCRAPIPWAPSGGHAWAAADPCLPWPPEAELRNAETLREDRRSILHLYRRLLAARRGSPALQHGALELLETPQDVVGYRRRAADDERLVLVNFGDARVHVPVGRTSTVEVAADGTAAGLPFDGWLTPSAAVVLR
jgi:alpha-glucosidase